MNASCEGPIKSNQIKSNQFYLSSIAWGVVAQSPEPGAHVLNARAFRIELEFRNVGFCGEGKTGVPGEKPLGAEKRTNNKLNPHMTSSPGIEPGPHWWKASALTTAPSLLPYHTIISSNPIQAWMHVEGPSFLTATRGERKSEMMGPPLTRTPLTRALDLLWLTRKKKETVRSLASSMRISCSWTHRAIPFVQSKLACLHSHCILSVTS